MGVNQTIYQELRAKYATIASLPPTEYPNETFNKPSPATIWARFNILEGDEQQIDIGAPSKIFRHSGILTVQVFAPLNNGAVSAIKVADAIADTFRNWCGVTVTCRNASVRSIGNDGFGWYQINITIPFHSDSIH
jgi:hypothetical protein